MKSLSAALRELARALGPDAVADAAAAAPRYARDFAGHDLGRAAGAVFPRSIEDVQAVVAWARRYRTPLTPVGARTSFWASTRVEGRLVVDLRRMDRLLGVDRANLTARAQSGATVAALDAALAAQGLFLPVCPDGFGDATLGSLVANDTSAGHGMFDGSIGDHLVSVTAVLGTGAVLRTGASSVLAGVPAFSRAGLPDPTGLLLGSEGALGIVTELILRVRPAPLTRSLSLAGPLPPGALAAAAQELRAGGLCHALRHDRFAVSGREELRAQAAAYAGSEDLEARVGGLRRVLERHGLKASVVPDEPRWAARGPAEGWKGVALAVPYSRVADVERLWSERLRAQVAGAARPEGFLRLYYGAAGVAALVGWSHPRESARAQEDLACEIRSLLLRFGVPYRIGTVWRTTTAGRVDPSYRAFLADMKKLWDPDNVLNPEVGLFPEAAAGARRAARRRPR